jgi:hypothetical protein
VIDVSLPGAPPWTVGPYPGQHLVAAESHRLDYLEPRVVEALYGLDPAPARWHRTTEAELAGADVHAVEILRTPLSGVDAALAILHVTLPQDALAALTRLAGHPAEARRLLPENATVTGQRAQTISHLTFAGGVPTVLPDRYAGWPAAHQWLWLAASATPVTTYPPDPDDPNLFDGLVHLSADWRALVLRDGVAFVGVTEDPGGDQAFHAFAESYVHSIYLDVFLLGRMQVGALHHLSNGLGRLRVGDVAARALYRQEHQMMEVRRTLWSQHITLHGHANDLIEKYQAQHRLPQLLQLVASDLTDMSRLVEASTSRSVNAGLGLLTVLGLPFGIAYAGGAVFADQSPLLFAVCTGIAVVLAGLLLTLFAPLRRMVDALRSSRRGGSAQPGR